MAEILLKLKEKKFKRYRRSFSQRYRQCNRCENDLNIDLNEEIVCALCGETFCKSCITNHQKYCYY